MPKKAKKKASWDEIGKMIGEKLEAEFKGNHYHTWEKVRVYHKHEGGFFGRALFIIGVLILLNMLGILAAIPVWVQVLIGIGFAFMRF